MKVLFLEKIKHICRNSIHSEENLNALLVDSNNLHGFNIKKSRAFYESLTTNACYNK